MPRRRLANGAVLLSVRGPLTATSAARISEEVAHCVIDAEPQVVIDLTGLDFLDSDGVDGLLGARHVARRNGCRVTISGLEDAVARILGLPA